MDNILNAIKCNICKNVLNSPVLLPCTHTVCKSHTEFVDVNGQITCYECGRDHKKQEFLPNAALAIIIEANIANMDFGPQHKRTKESCNKLEDVLKKTESLLNDPECLVYEEISELQRQLQLRREELKNQIDIEFDKVFKKLDEYKNRSKSHLETTEYNFAAKKMSVEVKNARNQLNKWIRVLNEVKMSNEPKWIEIESESEKTICELETKVDSFKENLLSSNLDNLRFQVSTIQKINLDEHFDFFKLSFQSEIVVDSDQRSQLFALCKLETKDILSLIYRGSRDGFGASDFHQKCDSRPNTLTIIKANTGNIFGGYTQMAWNQIGPKPHCTRDNKAFLFSLVNNENKPCRLDITEGNEDKAIICNSNDGPVFGKYELFCHSIYIQHNSNLRNVKNGASIGSSFLLPEYECKCTKSENGVTHNNCQRCKFLAGKYTFQVTEIEVFQKQ